jgi:uncharacterized protein (TIGR02453 family)
MAFPGIPRAGIKFLADLARHNDREWFQPRKETYENLVKLPMIELVSELNRDVARVAPGHTVIPEKALSRIYRDVRFAKDKSPYKTNIYAVWRGQGVGRHEGAGFYVSVSGKEVEAGGGLWMPPPEVLARVRDWIAEHHARLRKVLAAPALKKRMGALYDGDALARVPRGFEADHPAAELLRLKSLVLTKTFPASIAATPRLHAEVAAVFKTIAPFIRALDEACAA